MGIFQTEICCVLPHGAVNMRRSYVTRINVIINVLTEYNAPVTSILCGCVLNTLNCCIEPAFAASRMKCHFLNGKRRLDLEGSSKKVSKSFLILT